MIDVSVVVPVYNVERYIIESVQTILDQSHANIEIILVDDGSTDTSGALCEQFAQKDKRVTVIHQKNGGIGKARNAGMEIAQGKYIYFCDPDDWLYPDLIQDNWELAEENDAEIVIFGYDMQYRDSEGNVKKGRFSSLPKAQGCYDYEGFKTIFKECIFYSLTVWTRIYKRDFLKRNHLFFNDQKSGEDTVFNLEVFGYPFHHIVLNQKAYYCHVFRSGSAMQQYQPEIVEYQYAMAQKMEKLVDTAGFTGTQKEDLVSYFYVRMFSSITGNLSEASCTLTNKEKLRIVKEIAKDPKVKRAVRYLPLKGYGRRGAQMKLFLMKLGLYRSVLFFGSIKKKVNYS